MKKGIIEKTIDLGNNESAKVGIFKDGEEWLVLTLTKSRTYKTFKGALKGAKRLGVVWTPQNRGILKDD